MKRATAVVWIVYVLTFSECDLFPKKPSVPEIEAEINGVPPEALLQPPCSNTSALIGEETQSPDESTDAEDLSSEETVSLNLPSIAYSPSSEEVHTIVNYLETKGYFSNKTKEETAALLNAFLQDPAVNHAMNFCNCLSQLYGHYHNIHDDYRFLIAETRYNILTCERLAPAHYQSTNACNAKALTILVLLLTRGGCRGEECLRIKYGQFQLLRELYDNAAEADTCQSLGNLLNDSVLIQPNFFTNPNFSSSSILLQIVRNVTKYLTHIQGDLTKALEIFEAVLQSTTIENSEKIALKLEKANALHYYERFQEELEILQKLLQDSTLPQSIKGKVKVERLYNFLSSGQEKFDVLSCLDDLLEDSNIRDEVIKARATSSTISYFKDQSEGKQALSLYDRIAWGGSQAAINFQKAELLFKGCGDLEKDFNEAKLLYEQFLASPSGSEEDKSKARKRLTQMAVTQNISK